MIKYLKVAAGYAMGVAVFGFLCSMVGVDLDVALMTISQAAGRPWMPYAKW